MLESTNKLSTRIVWVTLAAGGKVPGYKKIDDGSLKTMIELVIP